MKKLILLFSLALISVASHAVTLFPYFVDVAGDYEEGVPAELSGDEMAPMYFSRPSFYRSIAETKAFYTDVMPFSTEEIIVKDLPEKDGMKITAYLSPMLDGVMSAIFLIETADNTFYICYDERKL